MARVLVVDDDPDMVRIVAFRLQAKGHRVIGTTSAEEALEAVAARGRPDVVVLDVSMPGMTGLDLLTELRAQDGLDTLPAIFLSARVLPAEIAAGRALGASYLTKPFIASALLKAIDEAIMPILEPGSPSHGW
jgi:CheY-like chemotaxis protein